MSHDPSPAWTARNRDTTPPGDAELRDDAALNPNEAIDNNGGSPSRSRSRSDSRRRRKKKSKKKRNPGLVKKLAFITHLLRTLDLVVFAELSALYYMEYAALLQVSSTDADNSRLNKDAPCSGSCCARPASTCT